MASRRDLKNKIDQVLLKLEHPAVKRMTDKVATPEAKDMIARISQRVLEQAATIRASLDPAVLKPVTDAMTEEVKSQIIDLKKDPKASVAKAKKAATAMAGSVAAQAAKGARKLGKRAAKTATGAMKSAQGKMAKAGTAARKSAKKSSK